MPPSGKRRKKKELVVVLHDLRSVHNVGSIFRTADGAGFLKIYCCGVTPTPLDRFGRVRQDFAKVALGAEKTMPFEKRVSTLRLIRSLKMQGYAILAVEQAAGSVRLNALKRVPAKVALVMGPEVEGLSQALLAAADRVVEIPMHGSKESLNVAVAFGIVAYRLALD